MSQNEAMTMTKDEALALIARATPNTDPFRVESEVWMKCDVGTWENDDMAKVLTCLIDMYLKADQPTDAEEWETRGDAIRELREELTHYTGKKVL